MAIVLNCRRCSQPRQLCPDEISHSCFCPFCGLELEASVMPIATAASNAAPQKRPPRRWPYALLMLILVLPPVAVFGAIGIQNGHRNGELQTTKNPSVPAKQKLNLRGNNTKPEIVLSAMVTPGPAVVDRRNAPAPPLPRPPPPTPSSAPDAELLPLPKPEKAADQRPAPPYRIQSADELREGLAKAPEIDLDSRDPKERKVADALRAKARKTAGSSHPLLALAKTREDLRGLPWRQESDCQLDKDRAKTLQQQSLLLRGTFAPLAEAINTAKTPGIRSAAYSFGNYAASLERLEGHEAGVNADLAPVLLQILQAESTALRMTVVRFLARRDTAEASAALAHRAVFDLDPEIRCEAVRALRNRPAKDYLPTLLAAFRHPWRPAAEHAAEALIALDAQEALQELVKIVRDPDPAAPFQTTAESKPMVRELVRVNHLRNCMLCHAAFTERTASTVPGVIPAPDQPAPSLSVEYYQRSQGEFVRADVTYLKQDFSATCTVKDSGKWPAEQRYDFVVRVRPATAEELAQPRPGSHSQRDAALYAIRHLSRHALGELRLISSTIMSLHLP